MFRICRDSSGFQLTSNEAKAFLDNNLGVKKVSLLSNKNHLHHLNDHFANKCEDGRYQSKIIIYPNKTYELPYKLRLTNNSIKLQNSISGDILEEGQFCVSGDPVKDELYAVACR